MYVAIVNRSDLVTNNEAALLTLAVQEQVIRHFAPAWDREPATVAFHVDAGSVPAGSHNIALVDTIDDAPAGVLGYHTEDQQGEWGIVAAKPELDNGAKVLTGDWSVSSVVSHEVLELLADPSVSFWAGDGQGTLYCLEVCLTGDTKISLLDGREVPIADLAGEREFWVYSCDTDGRIMPGRGHDARLTRRAATVVEVELDDGQTIRCTPDHRFLLRDGTYREAGNLMPGASLMPLYRRREPMRWGKAEVDYEQCLIPADEKWQFTHHLVIPGLRGGLLRHHADFNRFNNDPRNFEILTPPQHRQRHQEHSKALFAAGMHGFQAGWADPAKRARSAAAITAYNRSDAHREVAREIGRKAMRELWERPGFREHHRERGRQQVATFDEGKRLAALRAYHDDPDRVAAAVAKALVTWGPERKAAQWEAARQVRLADPVGMRRSAQKAMHVRWHVKRATVKDGCEWCANANAPVNHKVVAVRPAGTADVWDMTVDGPHNFALSAGVFVHNCDPTEAPAYMINGVAVSNFVCPAWFDPQAASGFDHLGLLTEPFSILPGGYVVYATGGQEQQKYGEEFPAWRREMKAYRSARTRHRVHGLHKAEGG